MILVYDPIHILKEWHWRAHLGIGLAYKLKSPASAPSYPCALFIRKNSSLGELGHRWFLAFLLHAWKHLYQRLFFNKVSLVQVFSCEFCEISKSTFFIEHLRTTASVWSVSAMNDQHQYDQPRENGINKVGDFRMVHRYTYHKLWDRDYALILEMAW